MERRTLDLTLIAAKGLKNPNLFSKSDIYAVVHIAGADSQPKLKTPVDREGNTNPSWNFPMKFTLDEAALQHNRLTLVVNLRAERALGDKDVGQVTVPIKDLFGDHKSIQFVRYQVRKPSGRPQGELNFSYKFGEKVIVGGPPLADEPYAMAGGPSTVYPPPTVGKIDEPVTAYPVAAGPSTVYPPPPQPQPAYPAAAAGYAQSGYGYPPQSAYQTAPAGTGYGYPQPAYQGAGYPPPQQMGHGYGYPPPQHGYGGFPPVQQPPKKNKFGGAGLGMGLLGGALGGLLIGDMISDAGSGFDDMGGFDF